MKKSATVGGRIQSATRVRQIRENSHLTQEQFAEILGISLSAYKKVESGENQISLSCLKRLHDEMGISADYVLFGKSANLDETWEAILNCSETDKMCLMLRLLVYFTEIKKGIYPLREEQVDYDKKNIKMIDKLHIHSGE